MAFSAAPLMTAALPLAPPPQHWGGEAAGEFAGATAIEATPDPPSPRFSIFPRRSAPPPRPPGCGLDARPRIRYAAGKDELKYARIVHAVLLAALPCVA